MIRRFLWILAFFLAAATTTVAQPVAPETPTTFGDAMRWYRAAAEKGYPRAQFLLGYMYETGVQVAQDLPLARMWYGKASVQGEPRALYRLARMYQDGRGGDIDIGEAARLYRAAAERGHVAAQSVLGYLYAKGEGVERDGPQAYLWLSLAARASNDTAAENLRRLEAVLDDTQIAAGEALVEGWSPAP